MPAIAASAARNRSGGAHTTKYVMEGIKTSAVRMRFIARSRASAGALLSKHKGGGTACRAHRFRPAGLRHVEQIYRRANVYRTPRRRAASARRRFAARLRFLLLVV